MKYTITKESVKRIIRTFVQAFIGSLVVTLPTVDFTVEKSAIKAVLLSVLASAIAAGLSAVMNIEQKGGNGMKWDEWVKKYKGKKTDYDGAYGVQCVDLADCYIAECLGLDIGFFGNAKYWWTNRNKSEWLKKNFTFVTPMYKNGELQKGDIGIRTSGTYGHIFIVSEATKNGKIKYYDQNATGNGDKMTLREKSYNSTVINGVLRPKDQSKLKTATAKTYKRVNANGGLNGYKKLTDKSKSVLIPDETKVEIVKATAGTKKINGKNYKMSQIKHKGNTYYVASTYLK